MSSKTAICRSPTTTNRCSLKGWSQLTNTCAGTDFGKPEAHQARVGDPVVQVRRATYGHLFRHLAHQPQEERDVVGGEAPERVLLGAHAPEVQSVRVQVQELAERPLVDQLAELEDGGVVLEHVADHQDPLPRLGEIDDLLRVGDRDRQGLLDQDVLAGVERVQRERGVRDGRRRDHDAGDVVAREDVVRVGGAASMSGNVSFISSSRRGSGSHTIARRPRSCHTRTWLIPHAPHPSTATFTSS